MILSRRRFIQIAAATVLPAGASVAAPEAATSYRSNPNALTAAQWGMVIDTRRLTRQEQLAAIIAACHTFHNVPTLPGARRMDWIERHPFPAAFPDMNPAFFPAAILARSFLTLCNHCRNPPCVRVCPTGASFCREDGVVGIDVHRCIGCRYCMAACPYGARGYNFQAPRLAGAHPGYPPRAQGVVEKCTFCAERLAVGQPPLCVEASEGAIVFGDLADPASPVRLLLAEHVSVRRKAALGTEPGVYYIL